MSPARLLSNDMNPFLPFQRISLGALLRKSVLCLMALFLSACGTLQAGIERTPVPNYGLTATLAALQSENEWLATLIAQPTQTPAPENTPIPPGTFASPSPTFTPTPAPAVFSNLRLSLQPEAEQTQRFYAAGVNRIYAVWDYANMRAGMTMKRVWRLDGEEWIVVEEDWDVDKYGQRGVMKGIAINDDENGLRPGEYSLSLLIDGEAQNLGSGTRPLYEIIFWILPHEIDGPVPSPDRSRAAIVQFAGRLVIEEPSGEMRLHAVAPEISHVAWFPDSRHLIYTERDRTQQERADEETGITHKLWLLDADTGDRSLIGATGENFHNPLVSPNGRYVAVLSGQTFVDGCQASPTLAVLELGEEYERKAVYTLSDFSGLPGPSTSSSGIYPGPLPSPFHWDAGSRLIADLWWSCSRAAPPDGEYRIDIRSMQGEKTGN